jgi:hypothetical protein
VGGLLGRQTSVSFWTWIKNSFATGDVTVSGGATSYVGGLVGYQYTTAAIYILRSYATGDVTVSGENTGTTAGGLVGYIYYRTGSNSTAVLECFATGDVNTTGGSSYSIAGGLVGYLRTYFAGNPTIDASYATGNVISNSGGASDRAGGLVGSILIRDRVGRALKIKDSYSTGYVSGQHYTGGFIGSNGTSRLSLITCYWNTETSGTTEAFGAGSVSVSGVTGKTTAQMMQQGEFSGFDFETPWRIVQNESFPYLKNIYSPTPHAISGIAYQDSGSIAIDPGVEVELAINGTAMYTASTGDNGFYYFLVGASTLSTNNIVLVGLDDAVYAGDTITAADSSGLTGLDIYGDNTLILRHDNGGSLTNTNIATAYDTVGNDLFAIGVNLLVWTGDTYAPDGDVIVTDANVEIDGTMTLGAYTLAILGTLDIDGTLNLTDNSAEIIVVGDIDLDGTLDATGVSADINVSGDWTNSGTFTAGSSTVTFYGGGAQTINAGGTGNDDKDFNNLTVSSGTTLQLSGTGLEINGTLSIASSSDTLDLNGQDLTVSGTVSNSGTVLLQGDETVTWTNDIDSGTVKYDGSGTYASGLIAGDAYNDLTFNGSGSWTLDAALDVNNDFTITSGTVATGGNSITVGGSWSNSGTFKHNSGTVTFDGSSNSEFYISGNSTFNNFICREAGADMIFEAGSKQIIRGAFTAPVSGGMLRSSVAGERWRIDPRGTVNVSGASIRDSRNDNGKFIDPRGATDSGNNRFWFTPQEVVPPRVLIPEIVITEVVVATDDVAVNLGDDMAGGVVSLGAGGYGGANTHTPGASKGFYRLVVKPAVMKSARMAAKRRMGEMMEAGPMKTGGIDAELRAGGLMNFFAPAVEPAVEGAAPAVESGMGEMMEASPIKTGGIDAEQRAGWFMSFFAPAERPAVEGAIPAAEDGKEEAGGIIPGDMTDTETGSTGGFFSFFTPAEEPAAVEGALPVVEGGTGEATEAAPMTTDDSESGPAISRNNSVVGFLMKAKK